jgi:parallel beta-helix repeat protein
VIVESLSLEGGLPLNQPVLFEKNDCTGNDGKGLDLWNATQSIVTLTGNDCIGNGGEGMFLDSPGLVVQGNRCDGNLGDGLVVFTNDATVTGNTASRNLHNGLMVSGASLPADGTGTTGSDNVIDGNSAEGNMGDGFVLVGGSNNSFTHNKASGNGDDGVDLETTACTNTVVDGNNFSSNGHEGIDNTGTDTDITDNVCRKNGHGLGPDIAGTGSASLGSVDAFDGNTFDTGDEVAFALMDNYGNTSP